MRARTEVRNPGHDNYERRYMADTMGSVESSPAGHNEETEWQFATDSLDRIASWLSGAPTRGYRVSAAGHVELHDTYFDTPDWQILRSGYTCRVRRKGERIEATLKSTAEMADGLRQREEITEHLVQGAVQDVHTLPGRFGETLRSVAGERELVRLFDIVTNRTIFVLADASGALGEIALDHTTIPLGNDLPAEHLLRVEVEVLSMDRALSFVDAIRQATGLYPAPVSKFQAALRATGQTSPLS